MNAEILSVGTELLLGHTVNTNTAAVARALSTLGINVLYSSVVGDNPERLRQAVQSALSRSDLLVTTGGLGPTEDDLTKETVVSAAGRKLEFNPECMAKIEEYFNGRSYGESQKKQAYLPPNCYVLQNDVGTAPGCCFESSNKKLVMMLPGPPSELLPMLQNYALPFLEQIEHSVIYSENLHVFGMGEGGAAEKLTSLTQGANPTVATYAKQCEMFVRVTAKAETMEKAKKMCLPISEKVKDCLKGFVYSSQNESLEETAVYLLKKAEKTVAVAESCTGGMLAKRITDVSGASEVFEMGAVTYANRIKEQVLGVPHEILAQYGAVSVQTAKAMAQGILKKANSSYGIGITGIAGPTGGTPEKPVGLIYIALSNGKHTWVRKMPGGGKAKSREWMRIAASSHALDMLIRCLDGREVEQETDFPLSMPAD